MKSLLLVLLNSGLIVGSPVRVNNSILDLGMAVETLADLMDPDVKSASQVNSLSAEIIPNLVRLIKEFKEGEGSEVGIGAGMLEAGMVEVVENILVNAEEICNTENPSLNSSFINGVTDELASRTSDTQSCFQLNTRVTGTDIRGSVIKKVVRTSDQECQKSCEQEPQCEYFLYFTDTHHQSWKHGECRLLRQQGEFQENEQGHTSGPKTCPDTKQDNIIKLKALIEKTVQDTLDVECSRLSSVESWKRDFVDQVEMNIEMSSFEGNQEGDIAMLEEDITDAILLANEKSPGARLSAAQTKQLLDTFLLQFYHLLSQSKLNKSLFDPSYVETEGSADYDDDNSEHNNENYIETQTDKDMQPSFSQDYMTKSNTADASVETDDISASQINSLNAEIIPNLARLINEFKEGEGSEVGIGAGMLEAGMVEVVENILVNAEEICSTENPSLNSSFINGVAEVLASRTSDGQDHRIKITELIQKTAQNTIDVECSRLSSNAEPLPMGEPDTKKYEEPKTHTHEDPPMDPCLHHSDTTMTPETGDEYGAKTSDTMTFSNDPIKSVIDPSLENENFIIDNSIDDTDAGSITFEDRDIIKPVTSRPSEADATENYPEVEPESEPYKDR